MITYASYFTHRAVISSIKCTLNGLGIFIQLFLIFCLPKSNPRFSFSRLVLFPRYTRDSQSRVTLNRCIHSTPIKQATPERVSVPHLGRHRSPSSPALVAQVHLSNYLATAFINLKQLPTSNSSSRGGAYVRWNSAGVNGGGSLLSGEVASEAGLYATQMHYVRLYYAADLRRSNVNVDPWGRQDLLVCIVNHVSVQYNV